MLEPSQNACGAVYRLVTHRLGLEDAAEAFRLFAGGQTGKVVLEPDGQ